MGLHKTEEKQETFAEEEAFSNVYCLIKASVKGKVFSKGDFLSPEEIERMSGVKVNERSYGVAVLNLRTIITDWFRGCGVVVTLKSESDGLRILTDDEATVHNHDLFKQRLQSLMTIHCRAQGVDTGAMSDEKKQDHDKRLVAQGRFVQGLMSINKAVGLVPYSRPDSEKD